MHWGTYVDREDWAKRFLALLAVGGLSDTVLANAVSYKGFRLALGPMQDFAVVFWLVMICLGGILWLPAFVSCIRFAVTALEAKVQSQAWRDRMWGSFW